MDENKRADIAEAVLERILYVLLPRVSMSTSDWVADLVREAMQPWIKAHLAEQKAHEVWAKGLEERAPIIAGVLRSARAYRFNEDGVVLCVSTAFNESRLNEARPWVVAELQRHFGREVPLRIERTA